MHSPEIESMAAHILAECEHARSAQGTTSEVTPDMLYHFEGMKAVLDSMFMQIDARSRLHQDSISRNPAGS